MTDAIRLVQWPWLIFGLVLAAALAGFSLSVDWSVQSWLDMAALVVSAISILGVLLYASGRARFRSGFWGAFRWIFIGVVTLQSLVHAVDVAKSRGFTASGTIALIVAVAAFIGWIYILQWIALTRLGKNVR